MASPSSKALPFISLAFAFVLAVLDAGFGFDALPLLEAVAPILALTAGGGLVNKFIDASVQKKKMFAAGATVKEVVGKTKEEAT